MSLQRLGPIIRFKNDLLSLGAVTISFLLIPMSSRALTRMPASPCRSAPASTSIGGKSSFPTGRKMELHVIRYASFNCDAGLLNALTKSCSKSQVSVPPFTQATEISFVANVATFLSRNSFCWDDKRRGKLLAFNASRSRSALSYFLSRLSASFATAPALFWALLAASAAPSAEAFAASASLIASLSRTSLNVWRDPISRRNVCLSDTFSRYSQDNKDPSQKCNQSYPAWSAVVWLG